MSTVWRTILLAPGTLKIQSRIVRAGHGAAEITVHARDKSEPGIIGENTDSERDVAMGLSGVLLTLVTAGLAKAPAGSIS